MDKKPSNEYIRGLVAGEGCFSFCTVGKKNDMNKPKIPAFILSMSAQDRELVNLVKESLSIKNKVYEYRPRIRKDNYNRQGMVMLIVRDFGQLKNIIVPFFYKKLVGNKGKQFEEWIENIGSDPDVPKRYRFIHKLYRIGYYDKNPRFQ